MRGRKPPRNDWEVEEDLRTLTRAAEIRKDPQRMQEAKNLLKQKRDAENAVLNMQPSSPSRNILSQATMGALPIPDPE